MRACTTNVPKPATQQPARTWRIASDWLVPNQPRTVRKPSAALFGGQAIESSCLNRLACLVRSLALAVICLLGGRWRMQANLSEGLRTTRRGFEDRVFVVLVRHRPPSIETQTSESADVRPRLPMSDRIELGCQNRGRVSRTVPNNIGGGSSRVLQTPSVPS